MLAEIWVCIGGNYSNNINMVVMATSSSKQQQAAYSSTKAKNKAYGSHAKHSYCCPVNHACAPLRHSSLVQANTPGAGLVTRRKTVQVLQKEVAEP